MLSIYLFLIIEIIGLYLLSKSGNRYRRFFPWIIMMSLTLALGLRYKVGMDYNTYEEVFNNPYSWHRNGFEPLWLYFIDSLRSLSIKSRLFFFLTSLLFVYGYYVGFKRLSPQIYVSFLLFIVIGTYGEGANTIRQSCAQALLFGGSNFFLSREWRKFLPFAIGASLLHLSAIIGIALMFLSIIRYSNLTRLLLIVGSLAIGQIIMTSSLSYIQSAVIVLGKYNYDPETFDPGVTTGSLRYVYTLAGIICIYLSQYSQKKLKYIEILVNLVVWGVVIYNISYLFLPVNRLTRYCFPFITVLLPILTKKFTPGSRYISEGGIALLFLLFLFKSVMRTPYSFDLNFI